MAFVFKKRYSYRPARTDNGILAFCDSTDDEVALEMNEEKKSN